VSLSGFSQPECYTPCFAASSEVLSVNQIPTYGSMSFRSTEPTSLQTFALYGKRFGGIEPHFKDYKSAAWGVLDSGLRDADSLTCLFMLLDCASLIALVLGMLLVEAGQRTRLDWHGERGLSFLQLGLRQLARLCYERLPLPILQALSKCNPPPACASQGKRDALACRIEFSRVVTFSY
jgi:hypothetical protein